MECKWMFIFVTYFTTKSMAVYINDTMTGFESARERCSLATPKISYSKTGPTVEISSVDVLQIDESAWVGYIKDYEVFRYLGCVHINNVTVQAHTTVKADIGECKSFCQPFTYFGVALEDGKTECKCININNPVTIWKHLIPCNSTGSSNVLAFGSPSRLSIYMEAPERISNILKNSTTWNMTQTYCGCLYDPTLQDYGWYNCSSPYKMYCYKDWRQNSSGREYEDFKSWNQAVDFCLNKPTYPYLLSYQPTELEVNNTQYWTSYVRAHVISHAKAEEHSNHVQYGYIKRVDTERYILRFGARELNYKILCNDPIVRDDSIADKNVAVYIAVPTTIVLVCSVVVVGVFLWRKRKVRQLPKSVFNNTARPKSSDDYNDICDKDESTHADYDMIKEQRESASTRNSFDSHSYSVLENTKKTKFEEPRSDDSDFAKESEENERKYQDHNYHILEKSESSMKNQSQEYKTTGYDYAKVMPKYESKLTKNEDPKHPSVTREETDYDHLGDGHGPNKITKTQHQPVFKNNDHVYNKAGQNATDTYDHINKEAVDLKAPRKNNHQTNTYNYLKDVTNNNDTYNHIKQGKGSYVDKEPHNEIDLSNASSEDDDDPYDHTSS